MLMLRGLGAVIFLILVWQGIIRLFHFPPYILPSPWQVAGSFSSNWQVLLANFMPTLLETVLGLLGGILLGMIIALMMISVRLIRFWLLPIIVMSQSIPTFAVAPLLVIWFGYGMLSKMVTVIMMLFFPVASAFYEGMKRTHLEWLEMASIMNGTQSKVLWHIRFPAALPNLVAGIKVATALAPIGAIISEWVGASQGLGFLMLTANARLEIDLVFACLVTIMILSLLLYGSVNFILARMIPWR